MSSLCAVVVREIRKVKKEAVSDVRISTRLANRTALIDPVGEPSLHGASICLIFNFSNVTCSVHRMFKVMPDLRSAFWRFRKTSATRLELRSSRNSVALFS